jgi:hypothetical protein
MQRKKDRGREEEGGREGKDVERSFTGIYHHEYDLEEEKEKNATKKKKR